MQPPPDEPVRYLTDAISAPRLMGKDAGHTLALAEQNARTIENLFARLQQEKREVLFVNDATLYLQAGHLNRFVEMLDTASTQVILIASVEPIADSELTRREKQLTEDLIKICDIVITMPRFRAKSC